ncbi:class I SAM-dependent DNA methyltransferase [Corallococcus sp. CA054B]|uniref:DNA methyltransferase n=1 Tax=Corallococcus sp. CA054B TaxID=2316734 RepID=UPI000EA2B22B|nr:DNA methyltransferase [Corallococcus sp. CA054B]RKG66661.1 class I SAM-dependent DNA methyltransferase [Corallococcus sp. CA054B]
MRSRESDKDDRLQQFVEWAGKLRGDEKGEAQLFLEHLFQAFGHKGIVEAGAVLEHRVRKKMGVKTTTNFADLVWKPRVLFEMKARGAQLERHYRQAFEYWMHLVPKRPRWVVLCNFDEFWIYDFDVEVEEPVDRVRLEELPSRSGALAFMRLAEEKPVFNVNRIDVTKAAADLVAGVFNSLVERRNDREAAQRFVLQCVMAKFAEDLELLPNELFTRILNESLESKRPSDTAYDLIGGLFRQMNCKQPAMSGRFKEVEYFNGGLFRDPTPLSLTKTELESLYSAAIQNWSKVNPAIFGTIFQASMDKAARHAYGAHFTSESDILKVVTPTIVKPWQERIEAARTLEELLDLRRDLLEFRVLDPACGSGNFLYVAFREMKRIETDLMLAIREFKGKKARAVTRGYLSVKQFYGFDRLPFAVELAKVTLLLAKELALAEAQKISAEGQASLEFEQPLPLDNLDENIRCTDALFTEWPKIDAIIGNPPFQSKNKALAEFGQEYLDRLRNAFPEVPGRADYCVYFIRKTHDHLPRNGRAGLVGTNTIRQNESREGGLDHIIQTTGTITEAVSTQEWSGDAGVHVSIVNWVKGKTKGKKALFTQSPSGDWSRVELETINASLTATIDVTSAQTLLVNANSGVCYQGQTHGHEGFLPKKDDLERIRADSTSRKVLHPYITGDEILGNLNSKPTRWIINLNHCEDSFTAMEHQAAFTHLKREVEPDISKAAREEREKTRKATGPRQGHAKRWWRHWRGRDEMIQAISGLSRYAACSRVTKRPIFTFISSAIHPSDVVQVFALEDDYSFGILQSSLHWQWFMARCSTLRNDFRYTSDTVFDSFPWPQKPTFNQARTVADTAIALRQLRNDVMTKHKWSLRDLYRASEQGGNNPLIGAQMALDRAVEAAYGMKSNADPLTFLLKLNLDLSASEAKGDEIVGPGLPQVVKDPKSFTSNDCVRAT